MYDAAGNVTSKNLEGKPSGFTHQNIDSPTYDGDTLTFGYGSTSLSDAVVVQARSIDNTAKGLVYFSLDFDIPELPYGVPMTVVFRGVYAINGATTDYSNTGLNGRKLDLGSAFEILDTKRSYYFVTNFVIETITHTVTTTGRQAAGRAILRLFHKSPSNESSVESRSFVELDFTTRQYSLDGPSKEPVFAYQNLRKRRELEFTYY